MSNSSIWPADRTLTDATIPDQSEPGSNGNEGVRRIPKALVLLEPHHHLVSYKGHSLGKSYPSADIDWAIKN